MNNLVAAQTHWKVEETAIQKSSDLGPEASAAIGSPTTLIQCDKSAPLTNNTHLRDALEPSVAC